MKKVAYEVTTASRHFSPRICVVFSMRQLRLLVNALTRKGVRVYVTRLREGKSFRETVETAYYGGVHGWGTMPVRSEERTRTYSKYTRLEVVNQTDTLTRAM